MIEKIQNESNPKPTNIIPDEDTLSKIKIRICRLAIDNFVYKNIIGQLQIINTTTESLFKHLFIIVVDKSGSMSGNPMTNVKYSLNRIIDATYKYSHLITQIISYDDKSTNFEIKRTDPISYYQNSVNNMYASGGTSFRSAFEKIKEIGANYMQNKNMVNISSVSILFLTDGEDSSVMKDKREELVDNLKSDLAKIINVNYTVHTVGFGGSHDFEFLNKLKEIGSNPGAYRYADPSESTDILSSKINSILDVIVTTNVTPIKIIDSGLKIIGSADNNKYWVNLTGIDLNVSYQFVLSINDTEPITLTSKIINLDEQNEIDSLRSEWYTYLIDKIASEVLILSTQISDSLDKSIHCELIKQRTKAILARLGEIDNKSLSNPNIDRCQKLLETVGLIKTGGKIDQLKLTDMKFEGKYATVSTSSVNPVRLPIQSVQYAQYAQFTRYKPRGYWSTIDVNKSGRCTANKDSPEVYKVIAHYKNSDACDWIRSNTYDTSLYPLIVASSIGRQSLVEAFISSGADISLVNNSGYNATDVAILYGYWKTLDILVNAGGTPRGGTPTLDGGDLLRTCISNNYFKTASKLIQYNFATITDSMLDSVPTTAGLEWLSSNSKKDISIETAITKGMYDHVESQIDSISQISWKPYADILFTKPNSDHVKIIRLLLERSKTDPNETWELVGVSEHHNNDLASKEVAWPLFLASKNGLTDVVDILLEYSTTDTINRQNEKGTTALWIASCNRHIDIVMKLLVTGADPNLANYKGDSPLIPCCQKGSDTIANLLLEAGAELSVYNLNRDNPIIICCRVGQAKILDMCLKRLTGIDKISILSACADIDGFNPLLAAAEQDRTECIKICVAHGADIEFRTSDQNQILPGATALHIASYYGRLNAVRTLCELGADPFAQTTQHGYTILHIAIKQSHKHIVAFIMDKYKQCTSIPDSENKLPIYYAKMVGNESIAMEFFTNHLADLIQEIMFVDYGMEKKCADILIKYGQSIGCYEFDQITQLDVGHQDIISTAILNNKQHLIQSLIQMNLLSGQKINPMALFWAAYTKTDGFVPDENVNQMIYRVQNISAKNLQNKMLTNLATGFPEILTKTDIVSPNTIIKMSDGFDIKIKTDVVALLKKSQTGTHTILGFIEKLKNTKIFPNGKAYAECILYESKIHMIKLIAEGEMILQPIHLMALYLYTMDFTIYQQVNQTLSNWDVHSIWHPFIYTLNQALDLILPFVGEVYRAIDHIFDPDRFVIGATFSSDTFSLGSTEWGHCTDLINKKEE